MTWWWMCVWVWKGPWPWFGGDTLVQRQGSEDAQIIGRHTQGLHFPLTGALLLNRPRKQ